MIADNPPIPRKILQNIVSPIIYATPNSKENSEVLCHPFQESDTNKGVKKCNLHILESTLTGKGSGDSEKSPTKCKSSQ